MKKFFLWFSSVILFTLGLTSCNWNWLPWNNSSEKAIEQPVISPGSGDYKEGKLSITITNPNSKGTIFFTLDGTDPDNTSDTYTEKINILGSTVVKAIVIDDDEKSAIAKATYNLNAGKTSSQLGSVYGTVNISENLSDSVKEKLKNSTVYVYTDEQTENVKSVKVGEEYYFDGLDTTKSYTFYFSNKEPKTFQSSRSALTVEDEDGEPIVATKLTVVPEEGAGVEAEATLKATGTISGTVKKHDVNGDLEDDHAGVVVYIPGTSYAAYTNEVGNFIMSGVPQGSYTVRAQYAGYTFSQKENVRLLSEGDEIPQTTIEDEFDLSFGKGTVKGTAVLSDATSTTDLSGIEIVMTSSDNKHAAETSTTASGVYMFSDVYPGTYTVQMHADGYETAILENIQVVGAEVNTIPTTSLQVIGGSLSGSVSISGKTDDLSGITILAEGDTGKSFFAITNTEGKFSWDKISPGTYKITASYAGYKSSSVEGIVVTMGATVENVVIQAMEKATYSIIGKVFLEGGTSFEGTSVLLQDTSLLQDTTDIENVSSASVFSGIDGKYVISGIEPGEYLLIFSRDGYVTDMSQIVTIGTKSICEVDDVVLKNAQGSVNGNVTLEGAIDYAGITILVICEDDSDITYNTVTDSTGHYSKGGIKPGNYKVQATQSGYVNGYTDSFSVSAGVSVTANDITLNVSQRSMYGKVTLEGREDFAGVKITATNINDPTKIYSALSNSSGVYALAGMDPGEYILSYSYDDYVSYTAPTVDLQTDSSLEAEDVELNKAKGKITGIVNLEGCTDHSGIVVTLIDLEGEELTYTTGSDGVYEFSVPSGNYPSGVRFTRDDFQTSAEAETITVLTDSTYGVKTKEMKCLAVPLKGVINLAGSDDNSGITVSIDDNDELSAVTAEDGSWRLEHAPLGYQTIRFSKTNVPDVTCEREITACNVVDIGTLTMIPNASTLKGYIYLKDMTDNSGITVTITTADRDDIVVKTTSDGAFEATNILSSSGDNIVNHDITFSKDGWVSQTISINDFEPLEERTLSEEITLVDETAPVISDVVINSGANYSNKPEVNVDLTASDAGSGIEKMSIQIIATIDGEAKDIYPSEYKWEDYKVGFEYKLEDLPASIYVGNATYTFVITTKDKAGNISDAFNKNITVTDVITSLSGVLDSEHLHWTKERSPYLVEADCLVSEGDTLIIDPGAEIRFAGNYSITISGGIQARGTADEKILFTSNIVNEELEVEKYGWHDVWNVSIDADGNPTGDGYYTQEYGTYTTTEVTTVYWKGIGIKGDSMTTSNTYTYSSGNILEYCELEYANTPVDASAGVYINHCNVHDCQSYINIDSDGANTLIFNSNLESGLRLYDGYSYSVVNNQIQNCFETNWGYPSVRNNTFTDASISLNGYQSNALTNNVFDNSNISFGWQSWASIYNNNFVNPPDTIVSTTNEYQSSKYYDARGNYWGAANTEELEYKGSKANISFISDYYDNFNYMRINYSNWLTQPVENAGYLGDAFIAFDYTVNSFEFDSGSYYPESQDPKLTLKIIPKYYKYDIAQMRIAQSQQELADAEWQTYSSESTFDVDTTKLSNGYATMYVQVMDSEGNASSAVCHNVPFDSPVIECSIEDGTEYNNPGSAVSYTATASDGSYINEWYIKLDGNTIRSNSGNCGSSVTLASSDWSECKLGMPYMAAGEHRLTIKVWDSAGNATEKVVSFTIIRSNSDKSSLAGTSWDSTTGQPLKDDSTVYLWHMDSSGAEVNNDLAAISRYKRSKGGFNGAARDLYTSNTISIDLSTNNAFTFEYWKKGNGILYLQKDDSFYAGRWNQLRWTSENSSGNTSEDCIGYNSPDNPQDWHYWTYVYNGSYAAVYCDGNLMKYEDGLSSTLNTNSNYLYMSEDSNVVVDEIRISNQARSSDEIAAYYKDAKAVLDSTTGELDAIVY